MFIRTGYNGDPGGVAEGCEILCLDESRALQSQAEEADINTIVKRFGLTGQMPSGVRTPQYADYDEVFDFHTAQNVIRAATESFLSLPAGMRSRFNNNPQVFLEFCDNPENKPEMIKLGLAYALKDDTIVPKEDVPPKEKDNGV